MTSPPATNSDYRRLQLLVEASRALAVSLDYAESLALLARLAVPTLADWCAVFTLDANGTLQRAEVACADPLNTELLEALVTYPLGNTPERAAVAHVIYTGYPLLIPRIEHELLHSLARYAAHLELLQTLRPISFAAVPLVARGRTLGALTLVTAASGRCLHADDLQLAQDLVDHAALAIDSARIYAAMQRSADRTARLQGVTAALAVARTPDEVTTEVVDRGLAALGAQAGAIALLNDDGDQLETVGSIGYDPEIVAAWQRFPLHLATPVTDAARLGEPVWLASLNERRKRYPHLAPVLGHAGPAAIAALPLRADGRVIGVLSASFVNEHPFDADDRAFMLALAQQAAQVLERTRLTAAIEASERQLRQLAQRTTLAYEAERQHLARELHDEAGQALTVLRISLEQALHEVPSDNAALRQRLSDALELASATMDQLRGLAHNLRPPALDTVGLGATLDDLCRATARRTGLQIHFAAGPLPPLPQGVTITLYRVVQEALTNTARHAHARAVWVAVHAEDGAASLTVEDDGQGFDPSTAQGVGLRGMRERVALLGGQIEIDAEPGGGTRLLAVVPLGAST